VAEWTLPALKVPAWGRCRCDRVQFRISAQPLLTMACHCRGCQRMSASAYSLSVAIPSAGFEIVRGEPVIGGLKGPELKHFFCPECMSWMFTKFLPEFVNVRATLLDELEWFAPYIETCTKSRLPWASTSAVHSFAEFPAMESFPQLIEEYTRACERAG
jgi:hypothetical protein